ncbi:MAG: DNA polymerase III subunit beta [Bacilli bacterium]|nr:DNA polymerase III subunit beta [Bacilli bacterium]
MRFNVNREYLLKALMMVAKAVPQKADLPILQNVKMSLNEKGLELMGSDNNITICTRVPYMAGDVELIKNAKQGSTLVQCKLLLEIVRHSESEFIDFELIDNSILKISYGDVVNRPNTLRAEEYPEIDLNVKGATFEVKSAEFTKQIEQTAFAASTKETRPILTAVNLSAHGGLLTATATDTARLARKTMEIETEENFSINIPAKKLLDIVHSFEGEDVVSIAVSDKKAAFSFGNTVISTRLINGDYPNTKNIVPKTFNYYLEVNSREFLNAMDRVSLFGGVIKLIMTEDEVEMISRSTITGSANVKLSTFQFSGERLEISFNSAFVTDAIRAVASEDVTIAFIGEMKPFVVKNVKDDSIDMLITPLRS